jgi:6,7-dimethyl-8-ribityllumazine synthase
MIKGISFLQLTSSPAEYERLSRFFSAIGLEPGRSWNEATSRGAAHLAPLGGIELIDGAMPPFAGFAFEVTSIDAAYQAAERWLKSEGLLSGEAGAESQLNPIAEATWKARYFTVEPEPGHKFSFWAWDETRTDQVKDKPIAVEGDLSADGMKFSIVVARWNAVITDRLLQGSLDALLRSGARRQDITIVRVPGAWEIPAAARTIANLGLEDAIITLGCLIRGETAHYEAIYNEVSRGIGQSQQETGIPHAFGVLTCETLEQALNRAGIKAGNKGFEAASAAIEMVSLRRKLVAAPQASGK